MAARRLHTPRLAPAAVVLAGGEGMRLAPLGLGVPKPWVPVGSTPFLVLVLRQLRRFGVRRCVVVLRRYRDAAVYRGLGTGASVGLALRYAAADRRGNAPSLARALRGIGSRCFVVNGDTYFTFDPRHLEAPHARTGAGVTLALVRQEDAGRYGSVVMDARGQVRTFREKGRRGPGLVYAGVLLAETRVLRSALPGLRSLEHEAFPALAATGALYGARVRGNFSDIGTPASYRRFVRTHRPTRP